MVNLTKLYTRTGDGGRTRLGDGSQVAKTDPRVEAFGAVDELNAALGVAGSCPCIPRIATALRVIQNDLFDIGADLCRPLPADEQPGEALRLTAGKAEVLEKWIDAWNADLNPLGSFILPAGTPAAAQMHLARTICRRAERRVVALRDSGARVSATVLIYLNRLSDLLFVGARLENQRTTGDVLWVPGGQM